jgi:hypothetical protein
LTQIGKSIDIFLTYGISCLEEKPNFIAWGGDGVRFFLFLGMFIVKIGGFDMFIKRIKLLLFFLGLISVSIMPFTTWPQWYGDYSCDFNAPVYVASSDPNISLSLTDLQQTNFVDLLSSSILDGIPRGHGYCYVEVDKKNMSFHATLLSWQDLPAEEIFGNIELQLRKGSDEKAFNMYEYSQLNIKCYGDGEIYIYIKPEGVQVGEVPAKYGHIGTIKLTREETNHIISLQRIKSQRPNYLKGIDSVHFEIGPKYNPDNKGRYNFYVTGVGLIK